MISQPNKRTRLKKTNPPNRSAKRGSKRSEKRKKPLPTRDDMNARRKERKDRPKEKTKPKETKTKRN